MNTGADRWIRWTTIGCVAMLALIAGTVSYLHMHTLVARHGQPGWVAALTPLSVDGMIVAASTTLLADSRSGRRGGVLPWALLVFGSVASLAANVAVAEPTLIGRAIAAWPSFALTASFELLTRQVRRGAPRERESSADASAQGEAKAVAARPVAPKLRLLSTPTADQARLRPANDLQRQAWQWALDNRALDGALPSGAQIARAHGRKERWGRLVKNAGLAGSLGAHEVQEPLTSQTAPGWRP